jgi:2-oxoglutarate ferredoxin oxidoreductase subunit alpha
MSERILMKGNEALAEATIQAGSLHFFGYPITPQNEVNAYLSARMPQVGGIYMQAESEVASINMVMGAAATGVRVLTSSSSPGISLKTEGISYLAGCDMPCLIVNIQRGGPGLGGIQPAQADYNQATKAPGHGDLHILVFAPASVQEMVDLVFHAYDKSEEYRIPAMMLGDGLLGQMMEPVQFPTHEIKKHAKPWALTGHQGKRAKNTITSLDLQAEELERKVLARFERYAHVQNNEVMFEEYLVDDAETVIVAYGVTSRIARTAINQARKAGHKVGMIRPITLWPFPIQRLQKLVKDGVAKDILVAELSMGQMVDDVKLAVEHKMPVHFFGRTGGVIITPDELIEQIEKIAKGRA